MKPRARNPSATAASNGWPTDPLRRRLWVASNGAGVERIDLADWRRRIIDNGRDIAHNRIERLLAAPDGGAWIGTRTGVDRIAGNAAQARTLGATGIVVGLFLPPGQKTPLPLDADCALWSIGDTALRRMPLAVPAGMRIGARSFLPTSNTSCASGTPLKRQRP